eukprot:TRINITY_DN67022_c6_g1_i1.p1 TRINITY_DN67022_c6_g1~~TRINITY_DN67022_c6_g1_i1.p1  ORF type:complete len:357 (+),score=23.58 TRINITY_DN67022_c6_g1_i1:494-1564(+)
MCHHQSTCEISKRSLVVSQQTKLHSQCLFDYSYVEVQFKCIVGLFCKSASQPCPSTNVSGASSSIVGGSYVAHWTCEDNVHDDCDPLQEGADCPGVCLDVDECSLGRHHCNETSSYCINHHGGHSCKCHPGWRAVDSFTCEDIDECADSPCTSRTICSNTIGSYRCDCEDGKQKNSDGLCVANQVETPTEGTREIEAPTCNEDCGVHSTCTQDPTSPTMYSCQCDHGWYSPTLDGRYCYLQNENRVVPSDNGNQPPTSTHTRTIVLAIVISSGVIILAVVFSVIGSVCFVKHFPHKAPEQMSKTFSGLQIFAPYLDQNRSGESRSSARRASTRLQDDVDIPFEEEGGDVTGSDSDK